MIFYFDLGALRFTTNGRVEFARGVENPDVSLETKKPNTPSRKMGFRLRDRWDRDGEKLSVGGKARGLDYAPYYLLNDQQRADREARIRAVEEGYIWEAVKLTAIESEALKSLGEKFEDKLRRDGWPDDVAAFKAATGQ